MFKRFIVLSASILALICSSEADAGQVVYADGLAHNLSSATTNYYLVVNSSTFNVSAGASIVPPADFTGESAIRASSGSINVSGGTVGGGANSSTNFSGGVGIQANGSTATTISGGQVIGGNGMFGGDGLDINSSSPTTISGGTIIGGDGNPVFGRGGFGISIQQSAQLTITGGTFAGGNGNPFLGVGGLHAQSLIDFGNSTVKISGGLFLNDIVADFENFGSGIDPTTQLDFFGTNLNYTNGVLSGTLGNGDFINQTVYTIGAMAVVNASHTQISFVPAVVPEPASATLILLGLGGVALVARIRHVTSGRSRPSC